MLVIGQGSSGNNGDVVGVLLAVAAALTYAAAVISQKPLPGRLHALEVTFITCAIGTVVCLPWTVDLFEVARTAPPPRCC